MANEIEVKLVAEQLNIKAIKDIEFAGVVSQDPWQISDLKNTYFDTANFKLRELKVGLRIRVDGERLIQTVKASGRAIGGLHERNESESDLDTFEIDVAKVDDPYLKILLEEALEDCGDFEPVFTTNFHRERTALHFDDGTQIEMAIDVGHIYYEDDSSRISEVELELVTGDASHLFKLSRQLITEHGFAISNASKARRGYALCSSLPVTHRRMSTTELSQGTEAEKTFEIICYAGLKHWQYYEQFLDSSLAADAILQMYRALLYITHVYHVFGALIPRHATTDLRANWEWLSESMEPIVESARKRQHLDQLLSEGLVDENVVADLLNASKAELKSHIEQFKAVLADSRYNLIMLGMSEWLFFKQWRKFIKESEQDLLNQPIVKFASAQLEHTLKELKRVYGPKVKLDGQDYIEQTSLLRRALDQGLFFGGLFDSKQRQQYRQPWLDLLAGSRELRFNEYAKQVFIDLDIKTEEDAEAWLDKRNESVFEAMEQTRKASFKSKPYWLR
ncbi:MAG: CYTH domain-containing protein [Kangiellaceae bacterium]|jgi:triphosphatase|nr:CYTH domain-containing protein [Kangiellaceae bacterium]